MTQTLLEGITNAGEVKTKSPQITGVAKPVAVASPATETKPASPLPSSLPPAKETIRKITVTKTGNSGWQIVIEGPVRQRDINSLLPKLRFEFRRLKRKRSIKRLNIERKDQTNG